MTKAKAKNAIEILSQSPATGSAFPEGVRRLAYRSVADGLEDWALLWPARPWPQAGQRLNRAHAISLQPCASLSRGPHRTLAGASP